MNAVAVNSAGLFVAVGYDNALNRAAYATSSNGSTWTTPALMGGGVAGYMFGVAVNSSGKFVAVGYNATSNVLISSSVDGSTWATPTVFAYQATLYGVAVNSLGKFVAVGRNYNTGYISYMTSSDGSSWSALTIMGTGVSGYPGAVAVNSAGLFVAVGYNNPGNYPVYATSN
jgi:hypothetical protein